MGSIGSIAKWNKTSNNITSIIKNSCVNDEKALHIKKKNQWLLLEDGIRDFLNLFLHFHNSKINAFK